MRPTRILAAVVSLGVAATLWMSPSAAIAQLEHDVDVHLELLGGGVSEAPDGSWYTRAHNRPLFATQIVNSGSSTETGVTVRITVPAEYRAVTASGDYWSCQGGSGTLICNSSFIAVPGEEWPDLQVTLDCWVYSYDEIRVGARPGDEAPEVGENEVRQTVFFDTST